MRRSRHEAIRIAEPHSQSRRTDRARKEPGADGAGSGRDGAGETRAFPKLTFEDMPKPAAPPPASSSPWDEPAPTGGGETRAFPKMSFEDFQKNEPAPMAPPPSPTPEAPSWDARPSGNFET